MSTEFWIQMIAYGASLGSLGGIIITKIKGLEKKQDTHNKIVEKFCKVEAEHNIMYKDYKKENK